MKLKHVLFIVLLLSINLYCQEDKIKELVSQGTKLHDEGKFKEAIEKYKAALEIDKNSPLANYEIAYSYFASSQFYDTIKHAKMVLEINTDFQVESFIILGNSFDMSGKPDDAEKTYKEGISKFPKEGLLHYNLAVCYTNKNEAEKAEQAVIDGLLIRPGHASSHLLLANLMENKGNRLKTMMPLYFFLLIEPDSPRSENAFKRLQALMAQGIEKKSEKEINVLLPPPGSEENPFRGAETLLSLLQASKYTEKNKGKSDMEFFTEISSSLFTALGEMKKENKGIWWDFYASTLAKIIKSGHGKTFCYYLAQSSKAEEVTKWLADNENKVDEMFKWLNQN